MKKVLFYTDTPIIGGAENQMFLLAKNLNKEDFMPILACSANPSLDKWCEKFEKYEIPVIRISTTNKHSLKHYFELKKILKKENIDLLHIHVWNPASCRYAFFAGKSAKIPIISTEHDPFQISPIKDLIKKITLKKVDKIITVSENNKLTLQELYPKHKRKFSVIHNGIDTKWWQAQTLRFTDADRREVKTKIFRAKEDTLIIISIAQLHERKGLIYLIRAMPRLTVEFPNIKLVIVGEGPERPKLEKLIEKLRMQAHIALLGRRKEIPKLLKSSNIFVLPSLREAFGLVNAEAMITPLPVIATKVGGIPEIIKDRKQGILVNPGSSDELCNALKELIRSPEKRQQYALAGQKRILENFDVKTMSAKYQEIYREVLAKKL